MHGWPALGFGVIQVNSGLNDLLGVPSTLWAQILSTAGSAGIATLSLGFGPDSGIRRVSELNMTLAAARRAFVLVTGPTVIRPSIHLRMSRRLRRPTGWRLAARAASAASTRSLTICASRSASSGALQRPMDLAEELLATAEHRWVVLEMDPHPISVWDARRIGEPDDRIRESQDCAVESSSPGHVRNRPAGAVRSHDRGSRLYRMRASCPQAPAAGAATPRRRSLRRC